MRTRWMMLMGLVLASLSARADSDRIDRSWTFDGDAPGAIAGGFAGAVGDWKVVATDEGKALAQTASSPDAVFNVVLAEGVKAKDVDLSVRIRAVSGENDRGGGLVWRAADAKNYYVARFNHLEDNYRVYKVVDGVRTMLQGTDVMHHDGWTTLRVTMSGDHVECYLDGRKYLDARDSTFPDAGKVGLWSKSDARTQFDDLRLKGD